MLMLLYAFPLTSLASDEAVAEPDQEFSDIVLGSDNTDGETIKFPDIVDSVETKENNYVQRVKAEEKDLYTFVFANGDGTNTMRVFSHPVKYIADDGSVRDISLDIEAKRGGGFVSADHGVVTTFESKLTDGISLEYNDVSVKLVPKLSLGTVPQAKLSSNGKSVSYAINDITSFVYELTYAGFKEDIVVEEYTGQTEYEFTLFTNGLTLCEEYGSYYLSDAEGNVEATIGDIIVFTADERNNTMGSMTYETVRANREYVLTIHLDAEYLADEETTYPIRIDPTIEINYDSNGSGAIQDVTINQSSTFSGTHTSLFVGRHSSGSLSRALMRFPNLSLSGISAEQISSATVEIRDMMCQSDEDITVQCHIYNNSAPAWSESSTTTWASVGNSYLGTLLDSHLISYGQGNVGNHRYSFDILTAAKAWANGTQSPAKGLVFKANSTFENQTGSNIKTWYKSFASYNRSDHRPSLSITYNDISGYDYYIAFQSDGKMLTSSSSYSLSRTTYSESNLYQKWFFTEVSSGVYIIRMKNNTNKCLTAVPSNYTITISDVSSGNSNQYWKIGTKSKNIVMQSMSTDTNIKDKLMYYTGSSFTLSSTNYTALGFLKISWFIPCTSMSLASVSINVNESRSVNLTCYPSNSNMNSGWAIEYTSSSNNVFTVTSNGKITAHNAGRAILTVRNKITGVSCSAYVSVTRPPTPDAQNKTKWCWAACAKMVGEHNGGSGKLNSGATQLTNTEGLHSYDGTDFYGLTPFLNPTCDTGQIEIVVNVHRDDSNQSGTADEIERALQFASQNNMEIETYGFGTGGISPYHKGVLNDELSNGRWVVANTFPLNDNINGHSIVIKSYDSELGVYTYWDPWTNLNEEFTVDELMMGTIGSMEYSPNRRILNFQICR